MRSNTWSQNDIRKIRRLYPYHNTREIARKLRRSYQSIKSYASTHHLRKLGRYAHRKWTFEQVELLKQYYSCTLSPELSKMIGRPIRAVYGKAHGMGLHKSPEIIALANRPNIIKYGMKYRFKKGHVSWSKGKKIGTHGRGAETQFKKGNLPHNALFDGIIRIRRNKSEGHERPYFYIRIGLARWQEYHVYLWQKHFGKVPKGHRVMFKDNNSMNCVPENLILRTKAEAMAEIRNRDEYIAQLMSHKKGIKGKIDTDLRTEILRHPELIKAKRLQLELNRKVHSK